MANFEPTIKLEHADSRGEIYSISMPGDKELMLLHSKEGALRGGHAHDVDEIVVLLTGRCKYRKHTEVKNREWQVEMMQGDSMFHEAGQYHLAEFLEDSWLLEWKLNTGKGLWRNIDDPEYRAKVNANAAG